jgi:vesicle transport through interaction with t-SNAREs protein 1
MDLEARSLQPSVKAGLLAKLREYKSDLSSVKSEVKRVSAPNAQQATREELLEAGMSDTLAVSSRIAYANSYELCACSTPAI